MAYQLPPEVASWSVVFQQLETNKTMLGIEDYSVSQTTLEQVFLSCLIMNSSPIVIIVLLLLLFRCFCSLLKFKILALEPENL